MNVSNVIFLSWLCVVGCGAAFLPDDGGYFADVVNDDIPDFDRAMETDGYVVAMEWTRIYLLQQLYRLRRARQEGILTQAGREEMFYIVAQVRHLTKELAQLQDAPSQPLDN